MSSWAQRVAELLPSRERAVSTLTELYGSTPERVLTNFKTYATEGYQGNGPVFSVMAVKALALSEVDFATRKDKLLVDPPPLLVAPWPGGTSQQLVAQMEVDVDLAGNAYIRRIGNRLVRLRPDWVDIIVGVSDDPVLSGAKIKTKLGYVYYEGGRSSGTDGVPILVEEVAHYTVYPDPLASFRGQSWISSVAREADADTLMSKHKGRFFYNAATPNLVVTATGTVSDDQRKSMKAQFKKKYESWENAYKTIYLEGGADIRVVGANMEQMAFTATQAAGETRIAAAAGVPPVVVGFVQGIQSATYSNYGQAMRRFADLTCRPRWRAIVDALAVLFPDLDGRLWYDDRNIGFLQQDAKDNAEILKEKALTIEALIRAGYLPDSVTVAVISGDYTLLEHGGLVSVQLVPPGGETEGDTP